MARTLASIRTESGASFAGVGGGFAGAAGVSAALWVFILRQAISDVAGLKGELDKRGVRPVFVHLGTPERAKPFFDYYGIGDVERVSDPGATVYRLPMFAISRIHPALTLLQPAVWAGWFKGALFKHGIGRSRKMASRCRPSFSEGAEDCAGVPL
ncbi:MAG: hypothetical protein WDN23_00010 [Edaphobacter sp.]